MSQEELDIAIKEYNGNYKYYQRLITMKLVSIGFSFSKVGRVLCVSYMSVHKWDQSRQKDGLSGLIPKFSGGRHPKLSNNMEKKLSDRIEREDHITMLDVQCILKDEIDVNFSLPHVRSIVRKLGFNYIKPKEDEEIILRKVLFKTK